MVGCAIRVNLIGDYHILISVHHTILVMGRNHFRNIDMSLLRFARPPITLLVSNLAQCSSFRKLFLTFALHVTILLVKRQQVMSFANVGVILDRIHVD